MIPEHTVRESGEVKGGGKEDSGALASVTQLVGVSSHRPKGRGFNPPSGTRLGYRLDPRLGRVQEAAESPRDRSSKGARVRKSLCAQGTFRGHFLLPLSCATSEM